MPEPLREETEELREEIREGERLWGNYDDGRWAWILDDGPVFYPAIPLRGHQGLFDWEVPEAIQSAISRAGMRRPKPTLSKGWVDRGDYAE